MGQKEFEKIVSFLKEKKASFEVLEHEPVFTSAHAAIECGTALSAGVKAMVLQSNHGRFFLFCLPADKKIDLEKATVITNELRLFLAQSSEVLRVTGCEVGSVSPFSGALSGLQTFFDQSILDNEIVVFNAGLHSCSVRMKSVDLKKLLDSVVALFSISK